MSWLIVPVTVILLRGALAVLLLAGAESIWGDCLSARVRRGLWIMCIFLMMLPQPHFSFQLFSIDLTFYHEQILNAAGVLPREIAGLVGNMKFAHTLHDYSFALTGLAYQNYPYLLGLILMILPALGMLLGSYLRCRSQAKKFMPVRDERILKIWEKVHGGARRLPLLLDSGKALHPPVLFGFFRQKLLLPVKQMAQLTDSEAEMLLTHEYIHYRAGDGIINIFTLFLWPFCWYNPFFLAARRRLRINCELACDAEVLKRFPRKTAEYGNLLLSFANTDRPPEVTMAFREYSGELRARIIYMTQLPDRRRSSIPVILLLALLLAAPFGLFSAVTRDRRENTYSLIAENSPLPAGDRDLLALWRVTVTERRGRKDSFSLIGKNRSFPIRLKALRSYWQLRREKGELRLEIRDDENAPETVVLGQKGTLRCGGIAKCLKIHPGKEKRSKLFSVDGEDFYLSVQ